MSWEATEHSLRLFAAQVAPEFHDENIVSVSPIVSA
jgi:hypothetical protein